jgi:hypothetical protein
MNLDEGYPPAWKAAQRHGCRKRAQDRESLAMVRGVVRRVFDTHQGNVLVPKLRKNALRTALERLLPSAQANPDAPESQAVLRALSLTPGGVAQAIRRHPEILTTQKLRPQPSGLKG